MLLPNGSTTVQQVPFNRIFRFRSLRLRFTSLQFFQLSFFILTILQITYFGSQFAGNDDSAMAQIASGGFTGKPSQFLVIINVLIGWILKTLYTFAPTIPWYALLIVVSIGFASTTFCNIILQHISSKTFRSPFSKHLSTICLLSPIIYYSYSNIQTLNYSSTAYFCSVCGILGMLLSLNNNYNKQILQPMLVTVIGYFWRDTAFLSVVVLTAPVVLLSVTAHNWRRYLQYSSLLGFIIFVLFQFDRFCYLKNREWSEYNNYDKARGALNGNKTFSLLYQSNSGYAHLLDASGFSPSQLDLFVGWYINMKTMPLKGMEAMAALTSSRINILNSQLHQPLLTDLLKLALLVSGITLIFTYCFKIKLIRYFGAAITTFVLLAAMFAYLDSNIRLPAYVREGLTLGFIASTVTMLLLTIGEDRHALWFARIDKGANSSIALILLISGIGLYQNNFSADNGIIQTSQRDFNKSVQQFADLVKGPTLGSNLPIAFGRENPFGIFNLTSLNFIPTGYLMNSPLNSERMKYFHLSEDIDQAILDGELSITYGDETKTIRTFQDYFCVTYSIPTIATTVKNTNSLFTSGVLRKGGTCDSSLVLDGFNPQEPVGLWSDNPDLEIGVTNCRGGEIETIGFNLHAPFGSFAKQITMRISGTTIEKESSQEIKVEPFQDNFVEIETTTCSVNLSSLSAGVIPMLVDPASQDHRTLFFGLSDLRLISN